MTGRPQREEPKETIRLTIGKDVYASMLPLLKNDTVTFASMSQLVETMIFLSEHIYIAEPDDSFVIGLAGIRADRIIEQIGDPALTTTRHVHVSLDVQAIGFLDLLVRKYHMLFKNRSDVVELLLLNIAGECGTPSGIRYYASRLAEVLDLHPVQVRKH